MTIENKALRNAVQYLYGKGTIRRDRDVVEKTGYNKATVSSYISGRTKASKDFQDKFEAVFNLSLADFSESANFEKVAYKDAMQLLAESVLQMKAEAQTGRQLMIEILAKVSDRSVMEVQLLAEKSLERNLSRIEDELKQGQ